MSELDIPYTGDDAADRRLDVIRPASAHGPLPVYVYFHGGGWTSGTRGARRWAGMGTRRR